MTGPVPGSPTGAPGEVPPAAGVMPHCYRHPKRETLIRCTRCDRPICPECMRPAAVGFQCPDDVAEGRRTVRAPRTSVGALLRDSPPWITGALVAVNVVVYVITGLQSPSGFAQPTDGPIDGLFYRWQLWPVAVDRDGSYWRLLTSAFLHVSPLHLIANMLALVVIGPTLEALLGRGRFLATYLIAALGGSVAIYAFGAVGVPVVGASGAIFGLFGASLVLVGRLDPEYRRVIIGVIALNFVFTFSVHGISRLGHLGGFVTGAIAAFAIGGLPRRRERVAGGMQAAGLGAIVAVLLLGTALRAAVGAF